MSLFRFRLQRVLGVRRIEEELARALWLEAEQKASQAEVEARTLQAGLADARRELARLQSQPRMGAAGVLIEQSLVERLRERWVQRTIQASRLRREAERLRQEMAERRVRVRGLELFESRAKESWRLEGEARANAELDERASATRAAQGAAANAKHHDERASSGAWKQP